MSIRIENRCVGCVLPCVDCGLKHVRVVQCDAYNCDAEAMYSTEEGDLCQDCIDDLLNDRWDALSTREKAKVLNLQEVCYYEQGEDSYDCRS